MGIAFESGKGRFVPILTFPHERGREKMDSGLRRNDGLGVRRGRDMGSGLR